MPVFISYRHTDRTKAFDIQRRLERAEIETYLDVLDPESKSTDDITEVITRNIRHCTHLIAVVSDNTQQSWRVPFEIGEATMVAKRISTFKNTSGSLPEYLEKWPVMSRMDHVDFFIRAYRSETMVARNRMLTDSVSTESFSEGGSAHRESKQFHDSLKRSIRMS
ncbi:toll/interleukin-1 receptor domain-containing protein [Sansalvadorimonas verongulae]|uniref:toll/interleukin-1 receptor domain-containing protein n=1 Tax=Sansalvadorimonas verongulae TaxID=2172824 RepID=UPI0012BBC11D|nr:toll/interleukin-1 receptor domain-containing protein [Sansalvadorimonas verongulae]MTI11738.1 toll/interleukin-1 receptor domain-containing protein [Sansalvadorimonas verongulae]